MEGCGKVASIIYLPLHDDRDVYCNANWTFALIGEAERDKYCIYCDCVILSNSLLSVCPYRDDLESLRYCIIITPSIFSLSFTHHPGGRGNLILRKFCLL